jgi:predicted nucleic acid-binding Zn ribbon protein
MRLATVAKCVVCGNPLPEPATTGRPRATCSDRCRKRKSRMRKGRRQRIASSAARSQRAYPAPTDLTSERKASTEQWSPGLWETFLTIWEACQTGNAATYASDSGDGTDTTELIGLAKAWLAENPGTGLQWDREDTLTVHFWISQELDTQNTADVVEPNARYRIDYNPPSGMCQIWFNGESPCKMFGEKRHNGLNICSRHLARIAA